MPLVLSNAAESYVINIGGVRQSENKPAVIELVAGDNVIALVDLAGDGATTLGYVVRVHRAEPERSGWLSSLWELLAHCLTSEQ